MPETYFTLANLKALHETLRTYPPLPCGYVCRPEVEMAIRRSIPKREPDMVGARPFDIFSSIPIHTKINQVEPSWIFHNRDLMQRYLADHLTETGLSCWAKLLSVT